MKLKICLLVSVLILVITTSSAMAYLTTFLPRISVGITYTDNVFLSGNNKEEDYITTITPGFTAQILGKSSGLEMSYDPSYTTYKNDSNDDLWRHTAALQGWTEVYANTRFEIQNYFFLTDDPSPESDITPSPDPDPIQPPNTTPRRGRNTFYRNSARAILNHQFGSNNNLNLSYTYRILENDDDTFYEDNQAHIPVASLQYWFDPLWGMEAVGRFTRGTYDQSKDFVGIPTDNFDDWYGSLRAVHRLDLKWNGYLQYAQTYRAWDGSSQLNDDYIVYNPSIGLDYLVSDRTTLSLNAGYFYRDVIDDRDNENDNTSGPSGFAELQHNFAQRANIFLSVSGGYSSADFTSQSNGFYKFYEPGGTITYDFTPDITGDVFSFYRWTRYLDAVPERTDETVGLGAGLSYNPLSWLFIRLRYSFQDFSSNETSGYKENRVFLGVESQPEMPFSW